MKNFPTPNIPSPETKIEKRINDAYLFSMTAESRHLNFSNWYALFSRVNDASAAANRITNHKTQSK